MKVGIITRHAYPNYGSLLQAYALQEAFAKLGLESMCIDYINKTEDSWRLCFSQLKESRMNSNYLKRIAYCCIQLPNYTLNTRAFRKMQKKCLRLSSKFSFAEDIKLLDVDLFCTGSDQVWNQIHNKLDKAYFLDFLKNDEKRIAYAASFGRDTIEDGDKDQIKRMVGKYNAIGVREESGIKILSGLGIDSTCVVDPVLLFDGIYWGEKATNVDETDNYVLIYQLHYNVELTRIAHKLAKEKKMKIIRLTCELKQRFCKGEKVKYLPNIEQFMGYIKKADFVVTDSFHGSVFSLLFHRQFIEIAPGVNKTRNENLLKMVGLMDRFANYDTVTQIADQVIDYDKVEVLLEKQRKLSWNYLTMAVNS